jgi:Zn-dependent peptidase ImmA (M78 family)
MKMAKQKAEAFLRSEKLLGPLPVDPFKIAATRNIVVTPKPDSAPGVSGMLLRHGNNFGILYATHIDNDGYQRFSIGHELGHYFLEGHVDHVFAKGGIHASHAGFVSADPFELEADCFASGLLMPAGPLQKILRLRDPGFAMVEKIAGDCRTSLTASAIRYSEITDDAVCVIVSTAGVVDFAFLSDAMKALPSIQWIKKGTPVPAETATAKFSPEQVLAAQRTAADIDVRYWLGGTKREIVSEEVIGLGSYGKTLTVLSSTRIGAEEETDDEEEERLIESWTPRFSR